MRLSLPTRLLASLSVLGFAGLSARAQFLTAEDFFNSGAQFYISNNIPLAKERTEAGLQVYPNDEKLHKLEELLKQQQQQQQQQKQEQQQKQQQQQNQQNQKDQQKSQSQQQQASQSQQDKNKDKDKEKEQAQKDAEQKKEQEQQAQEAQKKDESGDETNEVADAKGAHQMTPQEAARLLNSQKGNEQYLTLKPKEKPETLTKVIKDW